MVVWMLKLRRALVARRVQPAPAVRRALLALEALRVTRALPALEALRVTRAQAAKLAALVRLVTPATRVMPGPVGMQEAVAPRGTRARQAVREPQAMRAPAGTRGPVAHTMQAWTAANHSR